MYCFGRMRDRRTSVRGLGTGRKPAWVLGLRRKRTNLHEKYDYPMYDAPSSITSESTRLTTALRKGDVELRLRLR